MSPIAHSIEQQHLYNSLPFHQTLSLMDTPVCFCWLLSPYKDLHVATNLLNFSFYFVSISFQTHKQILIGGKKSHLFLPYCKQAPLRRTCADNSHSCLILTFLCMLDLGEALPCLALYLNCVFSFFRQPSYLYSFRDKKV